MRPHRPPRSTPRAIAACRERLVRTGADLAAYNSRENAADIAELRVALGIAEWNVYGVSYGTDLALQLLRDHPQGIRSVVLDSVVPPNRNIIDQWWEAPASGLAAIAAACAAQSACAAAYPDLAATYTATVNRLHATPAEIDVRNAAGATVRVTVDGFKLVPLLLEWSASPTLVVDLPRMIDNLANGDGTLAAAAIAASDVPVVAARAARRRFGADHVLRGNGELDHPGARTRAGEEPRCRGSPTTCCGSRRPAASSSTNAAHGASAGPIPHRSHPRSVPCRR